MIGVNKLMTIKCMICGLLNDESDEHIIPKALGNEKLRTNKVCKDCNSKLGQFVDSPFVNRFDVALIRHSKQIQGQKGKVPFPLSKGTDTNGNTILLDKNFKPRYQPSVKSTKEGFSILGNSKDEILTMGLKKLKRTTSSEKEIESFIQHVEAQEVKKTLPSIKFESPIDLNSSYIEFIKIAYEYIYEILGDEYYNDSIAHRLRTELRKSINAKPINLNGLIEDIPESLSSTWKYIQEDYHFLFITINSHNQLIVSIFLFNGTYSHHVLVSNNANKYQLKDKTHTPVFVQIKKSEL